MKGRMTALEAVPATTSLRRVHRLFSGGELAPVSARRYRYVLVGGSFHRTVEARRALRPEHQEEPDER